MKDKVDLEYQALISELTAMHTANWISTHDDDYRGVTYGEEMFRELAKKFRALGTSELAATTANSRYATALDVFNEFLFSICHDMNRRHEFISYCKERLNAGNGTGTSHS